MTGINRRRFMQLAGGTAALSALSPSIARAAGILANRRTGTLRDVDHIVVLMQKNRSFDHYLGTLRGVRGFGDPNPVTPPGGSPVWFRRDGSKEFAPFRPDADDLGLRFLEDLDHSWDGGAYDRWVPVRSATTMTYFTRASIEFASHGPSGATFHVTSVTHPDGPSATYRLRPARAPSTPRTREAATAGTT